jgi:pyrroloquinoline quinone biosynthesis protein B
VRAQVDAFGPLRPQRGLPRNSPVNTVLLTNADLDHTLGLILLREGGPLQVYATVAVRQTLEQGVRMSEILNAFNGVLWTEPANEFTPLLQGDGAAGGLYGRAILLPGEAPVYAQGRPGPPAGHSLAYQIMDRGTGARLLIAPDVGEISTPLVQALDESDAVLFDGTFWSETELLQVKPGARTARSMGHVPIGEGSLEILRSLRARLKVYLHINNTNPILDPRSPERHEVERAGIRVGEDGLEFEL